MSGLRRHCLSVQTEADRLTDAVVAHRDSIHGVGGLDGVAVVGDDDELDRLTQVQQLIAEATHVGFVERGVHFVQHGKGRGVDSQNGEDQGASGERALAAGEQG